jgi:hypothetical protein
MHAARPDVIAAAHSHSVHGKAWSSLGRPLDPITQDACAFYEDHAVFADFTGVVYQTSEGERIASTLGPKKAVILRNHGLLTVGETVDEAVWWFITMDRSCQAQLLAEAAGTPVKIEPADAAATREQVGTSSTISPPLEVGLNLGLKWGADERRQPQKCLFAAAVTGGKVYFRCSPGYIITWLKFPCGDMHHWAM